jgi:hypothetical protein
MILSVSAFKTKIHHWKYVIHCATGKDSTEPVKGKESSKKLYSDEEIKLRAKKFDPLFEVQLPKGMELPVLSKAEQEKVNEKIIASESGLSDLEILKLNLKKLLDSMD